MLEGGGRGERGRDEGGFEGRGVGKGTKKRKDGGGGSDGRKLKAYIYLLEIRSALSKFLSLKKFLRVSDPSNQNSYGAHPSKHVSVGY
jgi:hypothetical protein